MAHIGHCLIRGHFSGLIILAFLSFFFYCNNYFFVVLEFMSFSSIFRNRIQLRQNSANCYSCVQMHAWKKDSAQNAIVGYHIYVILISTMSNETIFMGKWFLKLPEQQTSENRSVHVLFLPSSSSHQWFGFHNSDLVGSLEAETCSGIPVTLRRCYLLHRTTLAHRVLPIGT